jgi:porin
MCREIHKGIGSLPTMVNATSIARGTTCVSFQLYRTLMWRALRSVTVLISASVSFSSGAIAQQAEQNLPQSLQPSAGRVQPIYEKLTDKDLALPEHPDRKPIDPEKTKPKASQPDREKRKTPEARPIRKVDQRVPGRPSRNLNAPSSAAELRQDQEDSMSDEESEGEEPSEDEEAGDQLPKRMLGLIPREIYNGGITFEAIYTGETFTKAKGGIVPNRRTSYRSNLDLVAIADTAKLGLWDKGRFFVYGQNLTGGIISPDYVGETQLFSNIDSTVAPGVRPYFTAVSEYWYEQYWMDDIFSVRVGKQDTNAIFALTDLGGEFVNSSFGAPPPIPMPTFPSSSLGLSTFVKLTDSATLGFGIFDGTAADGPQGVRWGFDTLGRNGAFSIYQAEFKPQFGLEAELPTTVRVGMWHHSNKNVWSEITASPNPITFSQNYGFFLTGDQMLWKENGAQDEQGFGIFGQYFSTPADRNAVSQYVGSGLVYKGFLPGRDDDVFGVGMGRVLFGNPYRQTEALGGTQVAHNETVIEAFYKYLVGPRLCLQPDIQYFARPSGQYKDALLAGMRFELVF